MGRPASGGPEAELWLGAHPRCSSRLLAATDSGEEHALSDWIEGDPARALGATVTERFGARLPFLFKVLAADQPLSLQAHPTLQQARDGYAAENGAGVPLDAPTRNYKDDNHKPELVVALSRFVALAGFREPKEAIALLSHFGFSSPDSPLFDAWRRLHGSPDSSGLRRFFETTLRTEREALRLSISQMVEIAVRSSTSGDADTKSLGAWLLRLAHLHPSDPGVIAAILLRLIVLEPGEALFLPPGNLHAYLGGLALELMASSDNVLRGGLTEKHVDLAELLRIVSFDSSLPAVRSGVRTKAAGGPARVRYPTSAAEFELSLISFDAGDSLHERGPTIVLCLDGAFEIESESTRVGVRRGDSFFCAADAPFTLRGAGRVALACVNPSA